jgi:hypothetical protein
MAVGIATSPACCASGQVFANSILKNESCRVIIDFLPRGDDAGQRDLTSSWNDWFFLSATASSSTARAEPRQADVAVSEIRS